MKYSKLFSMIFSTVLLLVSHLSMANVLVLTPQGAQFKKMVDNFISEIEDFDVQTFVVNKETKVEQLQQRYSELDPKAILLVGNSSTNLYGKFQKKASLKEFPPSIAIATLFLDKYTQSIENLTGIRYEIPLVTSALNVRMVVDKKINKIGVVHRSVMNELISENKKYLAPEAIELISLELESSKRDLTGELKKGLKKLENKDVDAIWVLNDNSLLTPKSIGKAWLPFIKKNKLPVIVGVESLLNSKLGFGTFAIVPDIESLGIQAASKFFDVVDNDWSISGIDIEQPISVQKIINANLLSKKGIPYKEDKLSTFDKVIH